MTPDERARSILQDGSLSWVERAVRLRILADSLPEDDRDSVYRYGEALFVAAPISETEGIRRAWGS